MSEKFNKPYDPKQNEEKIYKQWESSGYFNPDNLPAFPDGTPREQSWSCIMPPPNANGSLHAGHALFVTLQDIFTRFERMRGKRALWLPGADHAGFETQVVYEKKLAKEKRSRFQMSREELYKEIWDFTQYNKQFMEGQIKHLGASCDWSREKFTLDDDIVQIVYDTFKKLSDDKLLYRGLRSINWCPKHQTGLSNLEVSYEERTEPFYYIQYGPFTIATARPETKFSDKYIVVHPDDDRYAKYKHGQTFDVPWINGTITATLIKDKAGNPEMGTGAMTITPWHSEIDFDIAKRHNLDYEQIIDERGKLLPVAGEFAGMSIKDARPKIVEKLKELGLLIKIDEKYEHSVPLCYKCKREIEPQLKEQWFIKMSPLANRAREAIEKKDVKFVTERHKRIALHWLENLEDWNISRQIAWGIPIPAKICQDCGEGMIDLNNDVKKCQKCGSKKLEKDPDTFDTWFSSGQWPFATLGYPDKNDYKEFYPTNLMETGHDILFFWVLRMIMLGLYRTNKVPFKTVYLHGLVRDAKGIKMSKSKGNVISPLEISDKFGTDALRMALVVGNTPGTDLNLDPNKVGAYRKFANKLWNVARFVIMQVAEIDNLPNLDEENQIYRNLQNFVDEVTDDIQNYRLHLASEKIYHYIWHTFADKILEESKPILQGDDKKAAAIQARLLFEMLKIQLKILHPFMPFITETIWQELPEKDSDFLMVAFWPKK